MATGQSAPYDGVTSRTTSLSRVMLRNKAKVAWCFARSSSFSPAGMEVRHLDGNRANPALSNLTYGTPRENAHDRIAHGTMLYGERSPHSKWSDAEVAAAIDLYLAGGITQEAVGKLYGTSQQVVSRWISARGLANRHPSPTTSGTARGTAWARRTT